MWYILILYFVAIFFWNITVEEYANDDEGELKLFLNTILPPFAIAACAILGLVF